MFDDQGILLVLYLLFFYILLYYTYWVDLSFNIFNTTISGVNTNQYHVINQYSQICIFTQYMLYLLYAYVYGTSMLGIYEL